MLRKRDGTFDVPSDWSFYISYEFNYPWPGEWGNNDIELEYWIEDVAPEDNERFESGFKPTGIKWINQTQVAIDKALEEERLR